MLRTHQFIPPLTARTLAGQIVRAWDFKQKRNLVIALLDLSRPRDLAFVERLAAHASELVEWETVALIVFSAAPPMALAGPLAPGIILAADMSGRGARAYLGEDAFGPTGQQRSGVLVADRYGELYAQWVVTRDAPLPGVGEILSWLGQIEVACDECGVSHWLTGEWRPK